MVESSLDTFIRERIKSPEDLLSFMADFQYGWLDGDVLKSTSDKDIDEKYRLLQPEEVFRHKVGVCNDQALFEYYVLSKLVYVCKIFSIHHFYTSQHTFLIFHTSEGWFHFENSFAKYRGIHGPYSEPEDIINDVYTKLCDGNVEIGKGFKVTEIDPALLIGKKPTMTEFLEIAGFDFGKV